MKLNFTVTDKTGQIAGYPGRPRSTVEAYRGTGNEAFLDSPTSPDVA